MLFLPNSVFPNLSIPLTRIPFVLFALFQLILFSIYFSLAQLLVWFGVNLFGIWIVLLCQFITWQIGYLLFWTLFTIGIPQTATHMFQIFAAMACDQLWFSRNKARHDKIVPNAITISATINKLVLEHHSAWSTSLIRTPEIWQKSCSPFYKVNYDTGIWPYFLAQAAVIRSFSRLVIGCCYLISPLCSALYGEARVALLAARLATSLNITSFILEGDSLTVSLALQNPTIIQDWRIASMISQIRSIIPSSTSWSVSHINRSANFYTHHVTS